MTTSKTCRSTNRTTMALSNKVGDYWPASLFELASLPVYKTFPQAQLGRPNFFSHIPKRDPGLYEGLYVNETGWNKLEEVCAKLKAKTEKAYMNETFWIVVCNKANVPDPTVQGTRFCYQATAQGKAEELAKTNPGVDFFVMKSVSKTKMAGPVTTQLG